MLVTVSDGSVDAKVLQFQAIALKKGKHIVLYSRQVQGLVGALDIVNIVGHLYHILSRNWRFCLHFWWTLTSSAKLRWIAVSARINLFQVPSLARRDF